MEKVRPTLDVVAPRAAVSRQTVSNVDAPHLVRARTLARVQAAIDELGYRPDGAVLDTFLHAVTEHAQAADDRVTLFPHLVITASSTHIP